ncbi:hypothetical protein IWX58_004960 [Rubrivivax gelatinosus]|uniref:hypothetical protein n=1 Tax=Rubrivivax gelatinosus TaxID=28068 RepID=UPI0018CA7BDD|nr:hypothetical protein [Rubrivivax gelatinosus]MBG6083210.1 hypothetical protein [Rubrivivax gelatinosus]
MNGQNVSPIQTGLDALGVTAPDGMLAQLGIEGIQGDGLVKAVASRMERAIADHPEIRSEIVVTGAYILLSEVDDIELVRSKVLPYMDLAVDRGLAA